MGRQSLGPFAVESYEDFCPICRDTKRDLTPKPLIVQRMSEYSPRPGACLDCVFDMLDKTTATAAAGGDE